MIPEEKANDLIVYYFRAVSGSNYKEKLYNSRMCAIKTVNEVIKAIGQEDLIVDSPEVQLWSEVRSLLSQMKTI